jgi:disulfide bond formation protein DsbB
MSFEKRQRPLFHRFGRRDHVVQDNTTALPNYGHSHISTTGTYTLAAPSIGIVKTISFEGNDTAHAAGDFLVQTNSSGVTFAGSTHNVLQNTTDFNGSGAAASPTGAILVGLSTAEWALVSQSSGLGTAAAAQA